MKCLAGLSAALSVVLVACGADAPDLGEEIGPQACAVPLPPVVTFEGVKETPCSQSSDERIRAMSDEGIALTTDLGLPPGRYALPENSEPTQLVVMFHGHQNDSCSWRNHMREVTDHGAVVAVMDYTDLDNREVEGVGYVENWGWPVRSGAQDSITAAQYFMQRFPTITEVFNFGMSMGGNVSGYASYFEGAVRADCSPMWDYWISPEGVHNLTEEYVGARVLQPANELAGHAVREIEEENGGTLEEVPDRYEEITNVLHVADLSYLKGVVLSHGTLDQTVPYDQSVQMANALRLVGVPTHLYTVNGSDHVWEGLSDTQVFRTVFDEMFRLMDGGTVSNGETPILIP